MFGGVLTRDEGKGRILNPKPTWAFVEGSGLHRDKVRKLCRGMVLVVNASGFQKPPIREEMSQWYAKVVESLFDPGDHNVLGVAGMGSGVEVEVDACGDFWVSQHGYIKEILRARGIPESRRDKVPLAKDQAFFEILPTDLPADEASVKEAQSLTTPLRG